MSLDLVIADRGIALGYALLVYAAMYGVASLLVRRGGPRERTNGTEGRVGGLDGLRGVLALGVFVHHSVISQVWRSTGVWALGPNPVLNAAGQATVALFFMITGFLFARKAMAARIDWPAFYAGRLARLGPLYFLLVAVVVAIVMASSRGRFVDGRLQVVGEILHWLAFVAFDRPDINSYPRTWILIAGVNWSLQYEAIFYVCAVPALFLIHRVLRPAMALVVATAGLLGLLAYQRVAGFVWSDALFITHFVGGIGVAHAYAIPATRALVMSAPMRWIGAAAACALPFIDTSSGRATACLVLVFAAVVGGGSVFGLLKTRAAIWLGDVSYGIYLLHGLVLWTAYHAVTVPGTLPAFVAFALAAAAATVLLATVSYLRIELPAMQWQRARTRSAAT